MTVDVMKVCLFLFLIFFSSLGIVYCSPRSKRSWLLTSSFLSKLIFLSSMLTSALPEAMTMTKLVEVRQLIKVERILLLVLFTPFERLA